VGAQVGCSSWFLKWGSHMPRTRVSGWEQGLGCWEHIDMAWVTKKRRRGRACRGAARAASVGKSRSRCVRCMCGRAACAYVGLRLGSRLWVLGICRHGLGDKKSGGVSARVGGLRARLVWEGAARGALAACAAERRALCAAGQRGGGVGAHARRINTCFFCGGLYNSTRDLSIPPRFVQYPSHLALCA
jgi:hypothetical protein